MRVLSGLFFGFGLVLIGAGAIAGFVAFRHEVPNFAPPGEFINPNDSFAIACMEFVTWTLLGAIGAVFCGLAGLVTWILAECKPDRRDHGEVFS